MAVAEIASAPLRVLLTNLSLSSRSGTECYVRDVVLGLRRLGHVPMVYSPLCGEPAQELREQGVEVVEQLQDLAAAPDLIHGHHHPELMTALLQFPGVPA